MVKRAIYKDLQPGKYKTQPMLAHLESGVYFAVFKLDEKYVAKRKFVLLK